MPYGATAATRTKHHMSYHNRTIQRVVRMYLFSQFDGRSEDDDKVYQLASNHHENLKKTQELRKFSMHSTSIEVNIICSTHTKHVVAMSRNAKFWLVFVSGER